jgi:hypothetical protein
MSSKFGVFPPGELFVGVQRKKWYNTKSGFVRGGVEYLASGFDK